jgi:hypothetical protein
MNLALVSAGAASLVTAIAVWQVQEWRYGEKINEARYEQSEAARKVFESAQRQFELDLAQKDKAINEAIQRAQANAALARKLDSDVDSMRDELAATRSSLPQASCEAVRKHAETLSVTLGSCIREYSDMAREAQGYLSDVILLEESP